MDLQHYPPETKVIGTARPRFLHIVICSRAIPIVSPVERSIADAALAAGALAQRL